MRAGGPQALGLERDGGMGGGDLELLVPSVIPITYFLYYNKAESDIHAQKRTV